MEGFDCAILQFCPTDIQYILSRTDWFIIMIIIIIIIIIIISAIEEWHFPPINSLTV